MPAGALNQQWYLVWDGGNNWFQIKNRYTNKCVNVYNNGTPIIQYPCNSSHLNEWFQRT